MNHNELYDRALQIAIQAHQGQKDKSGRDYIMHPIRVAERCKDPKAKIVALLHDTIEDTHITADFLRSEGFPDEIVDGVLSVTKREGEDYDTFVHRAAQNAIGREVKMADLEDNMDIRRLKEIAEDDVARLRKYLRAWQYLICPTVTSFRKN
ncbi:MAG: GTP pyrophosphokinase [Prevotella sp.]|nr:GTP pyrophosphokinase [Prevotella sp.]